jgi:hypothetical protein
MEILSFIGHKNRLCRGTPSSSKSTDPGLMSHWINCARSE